MGTLCYQYVLKDEYASKTIGNNTAGVRVKIDWYEREYTIDLIEKTLTTVKPGTFASTQTVADRYSSGVRLLRLNGFGDYLHTATGTDEFADIELLEATGTLYLLKD